MNDDLILLKHGIRMAVSRMIPAEMAKFKVVIFGKDGLLTALAQDLGRLPSDTRTHRGQALNQFKSDVESFFGP